MILFLCGLAYELCMAYSGKLFMHSQSVILVFIAELWNNKGNKYQNNTTIWWVSARKT